MTKILLRHRGKATTTGIFKTGAGKFLEAVVGFLSSFYLLDFDYPKQNKIGMDILQFFKILIPVAVNAILKTYRKYKVESY